MVAPLNNNNNDNNNSNKYHVVKLGSFSEPYVLCAAEKDDKTLVTASAGGGLKEWNMESYECINSIQLDFTVRAMLQTRSRLYIVCGSDNGTIEIRRSNDLRAVVSSFKFQTTVRTICELTDGSFVSGCEDTELKRWNRNGTVLQTFDHSNVLKVMELKSDVIVSATDANLKVWRVSTGDCLHTLNDSFSCIQLLKLSETLFLSNLYNMVKVWNGDKGVCIENIPTYRTKAMLRLRGGVVVAPSIATTPPEYRTSLGIYELSPEYCDNASESWSQISLVELCCAAI